MYTLVRLYVAKVFYDAGTTTIDKVENFARRIKSVEVETNSGGPCWGPYVTLTGQDEQKVKKLLRSLCGISSASKTINSVDISATAGVALTDPKPKAKGRNETTWSVEMTKKDYELIASTFKSCLILRSIHKAKPSEIFDVLAGSFADALQEDNPRFDRERFLKACGVTEA